MNGLHQNMNEDTYILPNDIKAEFEAYEQAQDLIIRFRDFPDQFDELVETVLNSIYINKEYYQEFIRHILNFSYYRPDFLERSAKLISILYNNSKGDDELANTKKYFKMQFLHWYFDITNDDVYLFFIFLIYYLMTNGFFSKEEIVEMTRELYVRKRSFVNQLNAFFIFFSPEVYELDNVLYNSMLRFFVRLTNKKNCLHQKGIVLMEAFKSLSQNNFEILKKIRPKTYFGDPVLEMMINDDLEKFIEYSKTPNFDVNQSIVPPPMAPFPLFNFDLPIIHVAAAVGATKIFRCLMELGADRDRRAKNGATIAQYALLHGAKDIIQVLVDFDFDFSGSLPSSARSYNDKLFKWLISEKNCTDLEEISPTGSTVLTQAVLTGNLKIVKYCIENHLDISFVDENGVFLFFICLFLNFVLKMVMYYY